jgi:hypothetical protein
MDPKRPGTDPKLQEAYNRVMNGPSVPPPPAPMPAAPTMPQQSTAPMQPAPMPAAPVQPSAVPTQPAAPMTASTLAFNANNPSKNQGATVKRGGSKIMSLVVALGIIILLVVYTFVWIYVFKLQIPFLPQFSQ